jgi:hypothetical protein
MRNNNNDCCHSESTYGTKWKFLSLFSAGILIASIIAFVSEVPKQMIQSTLFGVQQTINSPPTVIPTAYGAGTLTNVFALPTDNIFSSKSYYSIAFTTATTGTIKTIEMAFPAGFNVASAKLVQVQNIGVGSLSVSGQVVKYTVATPVSVAAPKAIQIMIADITNAATSSNRVSVTTRDNSLPNPAVLDGPTNSATFTLIQVSNAMLAANSVTLPKIAGNSIDSARIQNGQVKLADLAANSVDGSKIVDSTITKSDVAPTFMKKASIPDCDTCTDGWNPDGTELVFYKIVDSQVLATSVVSLTPRGFSPDLCTAFITVAGSFNVECKDPVLNGVALNYVVIN